MMAAIILVCSAVFFLQFFVWYCRSIIAVSAKQPLSPEVQDVTGIQRVASGTDFNRVMQLLQLCPERPEDRQGIQAIGAYFRMLSFVARAPKEKSLHPISRNQFEPRFHFCRLPPLR